MSQSLTTLSNLHCCALIPKPVHSAAESSQTTGKYTMIFYINLLYNEYHGIQIFIFHGELWQQTNNFSEIIHEIHNVYNLCNKCLYLKYDSQFKADCNWFFDCEHTNVAAKNVFIFSLWTTSTDEVSLNELVS